MTEEQFPPHTGVTEPPKAAQRTFEREPARRVFAAELREARIQFKDNGDEKSPSYVLMPTGVRANRIFIVGSLTEKERRGDQNVYYTARIADPTGVFYASAGTYQPEAMQQLTKIEAPAFVAVVGKPSIYESPDGAKRTSLRIESITQVDGDTRNCWVLDTAGSTLDRLDLFEQVTVGDSVTASIPVTQSDATPLPGSTGGATAEDVQKAREHYNTEPEKYRRMVYDALSQLQL